MASSADKSTSDENEPQSYQIEYAEGAQEDIEKAYLWRSSITSPETATRWVEGLRAAIDSLSFMPYRFASLQNDPLSRRLLYGSGNGAYRIIYRVIETMDLGDTALVRILHVYHGARQTITSEDIAEDHE
jgi:plasmid stabilization system protein ParE